MTNLISQAFINKEKKLVTFVTGGDPDFATSLEIIKTIINNGADIIEIGMPFTDPMADGPGIQASYLRALKEGQNLKKTIKLIKNFRKDNDNTPVVLMGYYNPIYKFGVKKFLKEAKSSCSRHFFIVDNA